MALPAAACPIATLDGEHDMASLTPDKFSPIGSVRALDVDTRVQRAAAGANCVAGFAAGYPCSNIDLLSFTPLAQIGGGSGNDIWGWTDPQTGKEYALMGRSSGTAFVDVTDGENPVYLGNLPTHTSNSSWRDIKVYANHAYIVSEASGHGMQVFDLTQLRGITTPQTFSNTVHYSNFGNAHNIIINEETGFAYAVGTSTCSGGLHMVDISTPTAPSFSGCYSADGYTHDAQCVVFRGPTHRFHHGSELCFNSNEDTLTIVDVTDKANPVELARLPYAGSGYSHQGWLTEDHQYFLLDDELDEQSFGHPTRTRVFDVSDPALPSLIGQYNSSAAAIDHNLYVSGDYVFQANYRAGLRILQVRDAASADLVEEAFFDIYPSSDSASFNGAWSNYPYFESGNVIVSGIEQGLFVLRPTSLTPSFDATPGTANLEVCGVGSASTSLDVRAFGGFVDPVDFTVSGAPSGVNATLNPASLVPPGATTLFADVTAPSSGQYLLNVDGVSGDQSYATTVGLDLSIDLPSAVTSLLPLEGATDVSSNQTLHWSASDNAYRYDLQIATDAAFNNVIVQADGLTMNSYPASSLPAGVPIYWRVTSHNACGAQPSSAFSFSTAAASCELFASTDVPKAIDPGPSNSISSALSSDALGQIVDVNVVDLNGQHTYLGDLDFQLEGPLVNAHSGGLNTRHSQRALVRIIERTCSSTDNFDLSLDDDAPAGSLPCPYNDGGTYQPSNSLSAFNGSPGSGDWMLFVNDNAGLDGGALQGWGLEICTTPPPESLDSDGDGVADDQDNCTLVSNPDQRDTHGDGYGNLCDPDLDNDGNVSATDLGLLRLAFFNTGPGLDEDLNGDDVVNVSDLAIMKLYFFGPPGPSGIALE
jgi:choice-of-anchor B domain-containing protein